MSWANGDARVNLLPRNSHGGGSVGLVGSSYPPPLPERRHTLASANSAIDFNNPHLQRPIGISRQQSIDDGFKPDVGCDEFAPTTYGFVTVDYDQRDAQIPHKTAQYTTDYPNLENRQIHPVLSKQASFNSRQQPPNLPPGGYHHQGVANYPQPIQQRVFTSTFPGQPSSEECSQVCSECPGGAPCEYGVMPQPDYPLVEIHHHQPHPPSCHNVGPDGSYSINLDPGNMGHSNQMMSRNSSASSNHLDHCDIRDFEEWRGTRGSRESLGSLPPDLQRHLEDCRCQCDHLGYGNYQVRVYYFYLFIIFFL